MLLSISEKHWPGLSHSILTHTAIAVPTGNLVYASSGLTPSQFLENTRHSLSTSKKLNQPTLHNF